MRAIKLTGSFHICEGCDDIEHVEKGQIRKGELKIIEGWKDADGDWIGSKDDYDDIQDAADSGDYDVDDVYDDSYLECPENEHDSDDGWEMEALAAVYICGACGERKRSLDAATDCCDEKENEN
jgi:hypothetical protein